MKKYFVTGLVILLPLAVTIAVVVFIFNLVTVPLASAVVSVLNHYDLVDKDIFLATGPHLQFFISQLCILTFLFFFTVLLGMIARYFFVHYIIKLWDYIFHKIPLVRSVYKASQDVINTLFSSKTNAFKQVVMVPFPNPGVYSIGLVTQDNLKGFAKAADEEMLAVFVPTAPNPTSGFLMMFPKKEVIHLDMKTEDAFKCIVSCGVVMTPFQTITQEQADKKRNAE